MRRIAIACLTLPLLVACGDDTEEGTPETLVTSEVDSAPSTTGPASDELPTGPCDAAFADVAAGAASDDVEALFPAARDCSDLADWIAAAEAHPDVIGDEDPAVVAEEVCQSGEGLSATAMCQEVLATS